jgi:hypothetical protein
MKLKPAARGTLELIGSGRAVIEVDHKAHCGRVDTIDGVTIRDPEFPDRKMLLPGVWTLFQAGLIDAFGLITEAGQRAREDSEK